MKKITTYLFSVLFALSFLGVTLHATSLGGDAADIKTISCSAGDLGELRAGVAVDSTVIACTFSNNDPEGFKFTYASSNASILKGVTTDNSDQEVAYTVYAVIDGYSGNTTETAAFGATGAANDKELTVLAADGNDISTSITQATNSKTMTMKLGVALAANTKLLAQDFADTITVTIVNL